MKTKYLLAIICIILCSAASVAQNTVSQAEYEKWVDYVNCKFIVAFIDKKIAQKDKEIDNKYKNDYTDRIKSKLNADSPDRAVKYDEINKAIGSYPKAKMLSDYIRVYIE